MDDDKYLKHLNAMFRHDANRLLSKKDTKNKQTQNKKKTKSGSASGSSTEEEDEEEPEEEAAVSFRIL